MRRADASHRNPDVGGKILQRATTEVLNAVYEVEFEGYSYGFRPGRSQHKALDALYIALMKKRVNWVLDADIQAFFDTIDHEWLLKFIGRRIRDGRLLRQIARWLKAGVMEEGKLTRSEEGTPQGGRISPLLSNIYLHYVLDLWVEEPGTAGEARSNVHQQKSVFLCGWLWG